ncbi:hypothetical protein L1987_13720 [Smallanthus sonchifolius]|uniref:Uncharacterized protein n=1 Tax=Smallanthus sonchifolius TaxID=185202 RepID=A0ACB9JIV4_9ASTR|nr:hypothetical protein L1987_13720 [Smallanthus sonchifolius]
MEMEDHVRAPTPPTTVTTPLVIHVDANISEWAVELKSQNAILQTVVESLTKIMQSLQTIVVAQALEIKDLLSHARSKSAKAKSFKRLLRCNTMKVMV